MHGHTEVSGLRNLRDETHGQWEDGLKKEFTVDSTRGWDYFGCCDFVGELFGVL